MDRKTNRQQRERERPNLKEREGRKPCNKSSNATTLFLMPTTRICRRSVAESKRSDCEAGFELEARGRGYVRSQFGRPSVSRLLILRTKVDIFLLLPRVKRTDDYLRFASSFSVSPPASLCCLARPCPYIYCFVPKIKAQAREQMIYGLLLYVLLLYVCACVCVCVLPE